MHNSSGPKGRYFYNEKHYISKKKYLVISIIWYIINKYKHLITYLQISLSFEENIVIFTYDI